jgi:hypothetical protein
LEHLARRLGRPLSRRVIFALLSIACVLLAVGYVTWVVLRHQVMIRNASVSSGPISPSGPDAIAALEKRPHLMFRSTALGDTFGGIALVPLAAPGGPRTMATLQCDRVYFAAGIGICLAGYQGSSRHTAGISSTPNFNYGIHFR